MLFFDYRAISESERTGGSDNVVFRAPNVSFSIMEKLNVFGELF